MEYYAALKTNGCGYNWHGKRSKITKNKARKACIISFPIFFLKKSLLCISICICMTVHISRNTDCTMSTAPTYLGGNVTGKGEKTTPICVLYCLTKSVYYFCKQNFLVFFCFGPCHAYAGSQFLNQRLNPHPLHWKHVVLTTRIRGK